ncbi:MAG: 3-oxoacyl-[acyl-carrier-protein] synthase III C-terminal domain-containing protein, partial [Verrucomicrobiota bacterium]
ALYLPEKDSQIPEAERDRYNGQLGTLQMNGQSIYKFAVTVLTESVRHALEATDLTSEDISVVLPHQSNIRMLQSAWKQLGFAEDRIHINIDRFGNTGAASCGLCLHECLEESRLTAGDKFVFVAQGGGLSWGASVWQL